MELRNTTMEILSFSNGLRKSIFESGAMFRWPHG